MWRKFKSYFTSAPLELTTEKENQMIESLAHRISNMDIELAASLFLEPYEPISAIIGETVLVWASPFADLIGINGYEYSLLLRKHENIKQLRLRIEELKKEKDAKKKG